MNKMALVVIISLTILAGGYFLLSGNPAKQSGDPAKQSSATQTPQNKTNANGQMVMMKSTSFAFSPNAIRAKVNQPITIHVSAQERHTFTIDELGVNAETPGGQTTPVTFTPNKKGVFTYYCSLPGHRESGQSGTITVE